MDEDRRRLVVTLYTETQAEVQASALAADEPKQRIKELVATTVEGTAALFGLKKKSAKRGKK